MSNQDIKCTCLLDGKPITNGNYDTKSAIVQSCKSIDAAKAIIKSIESKETLHIYNSQQKKEMIEEILSVLNKNQYNFNQASEILELVDLTIQELLRLRNA